jgi:hypothetical protein
VRRISVKPLRGRPEDAGPALMGQAALSHMSAAS